MSQPATGGYVYIMEPNGSDMFKVGMCSMIESILSRYKTHCGLFTVTVYRSLHPRTDEKFMHSTLARHRVAAEFFHRGDDGVSVFDRANVLAQTRMGPPVLVHREQVRLPRTRTLVVPCVTDMSLVLAVEEETKTERGLTRAIAGMLAHSEVGVGDADAVELKQRALRPESSVDELWMYCAHLYKRSRGLDRLDGAFLRENGVRFTDPETDMMIAVLYPPTGTLPCTELTAVKAALIREVVEALGLASPFDTEHNIPDMMALWKAKIKDTEMFKSYQANARLFSSGGRTKEWDLKAVIKAVNMVLGGVGIGLTGITTRKQVRRKRSGTTVYELDTDRVARMLELARLRMRSSGDRAATPNAHARELLLLDEYPKFAHLVDRDIAFGSRAPPPR